MAAPTQISGNRELFALSWRAGIILLTERNDTSVLRDCIKTAVDVCSEKHEIVQSTLQIHIILFNRVIARNEPTITAELEEIGKDIANLL
jgi:hypothetical protein